ncbi:MAG: sulfite exporter TauE/SafE family protein [Anaerolineales bacterium]
MFEQYYYWLSTLAREFTLPISALADQINIPLVSALLFGLIGAFAPCQLSTGVAALSFISRRAGEPRSGKAVWTQTIAYLAGKATVYLVVGGVIVLLGLQINQNYPEFDWRLHRDRQVPKEQVTADLTGAVFTCPHTPATDKKQRMREAHLVDADGYTWAPDVAAQGA